MPSAWFAVDQHVNAIDTMQSIALAEESSRRHSARLSLLLNLGLYRQEVTQRWVLPVHDGQPATASVRLNLGFQHPDAAIMEMPEKGKICDLGGYKGSLSARYIHPATLRHEARGFRRPAAVEREARLTHLVGTQWISSH